MRTLRAWSWWLVLCPVALAAAGDRPGAVQVRDVDGQVLRPFSTGAAASVVFFVATDCPVSNGYAPEIQRVCREYGSRGVGCSLIYEDVDTTPGTSALDGQVRTHLREYNYAAVPASIDRERVVAAAARAAVTPTAVIVDRSGDLRYRGRVDNLYAALGKTRQQVTSHDVREALDAVLSGRRVAHPETEPIGCFITDPAVLRTHRHD
jgi:hypothetical protein